MQRNQLRSAVAELRSRDAEMSGSSTMAAASPIRGRAPVVAEVEPNIDDSRLARALLDRGRAGAARARAEGFDPKVPLSADGAPKTGFGRMVSRLMDRHAARAGYSAAALLAANQGVQASTAGGASATTLVGTTTGISVSPGGSQPAISFDPVLVMLVNRITGGFSDAEYQLASSLGFTGYIDYHLDPASIPDPEVDQFLDDDPSENIFMGGQKSALERVAFDSAVELVLAQDTSGSYYLPTFWVPLLQATNLYRGCLTKHRLLDRMAEFWTDHFNIDLRLPAQGVTKPVDDREVIRANALGTFKAMLLASAKSPAMLNYLDQSSSSHPNPNENYARELLELHTLGEGNGYDETDVVNVARILTGWTIGTDIKFDFDDSMHEGGLPAMLILPNELPPISIPAGDTMNPAADVVQGEELLRQLAEHPITANYIAAKVTRFLLADDPDPSVVNAAAAAYGLDGDIPAMIKAILTPANLTNLLNTTPSTLRFKRPRQLACWIYNVLFSGPFFDPNNVINPLTALNDRLESMGNAPYYWGPPNGYPDAEGAWIGDLLGRWDLIDSILRNEFEGMNVPYGFLLGLLGTFTVPRMGERMNEILAGGAMTTDEVYWIQQYVDLTGILFNLGAITLQTSVREIYAIALSTPTCQYY